MKISKNICIVSSSIPPNFAGGGVLAYEYALRLFKKNKLLFIFTEKSVPNEGEKFTFDRFEKIPPKKIITVPKEINKDKKRSKSIIKYFLPFIIFQFNLLCSIFWKIFQTRKSFEIVHSIGASSWLNLYSVAIGKIFGKKTILEMTLLGCDDPISVGKNKIALLGVIRRWLFSKADIIISISPILSQTYNLSGMPIQKLREVANPVDIYKFCPISIKERLKLHKKLGFKKKQKIFLFVGMIEKRKGVDLLIKSYAQVFKNFPNTMLLLVGPTSINKENKEFFEKMKKLVQNLNIKENVVFTGLRDNVDEYMKISDIFVFLSRREGFGTVVVEAMSTGLPVIALNIPGITEYIIQNKKDGIIIQEENPNKIVLAIEELLKNRDLYKYISKNARKTVENRFSTEIIDQQYQRIYEEIT